MDNDVLMLLHSDLIFLQHNDLYSDFFVDNIAGDAHRWFQVLDRWFRNLKCCFVASY